MIVHSREELYNFLRTQDFNQKRITSLSSVYFLIKYDDKEYPVYFFPFEDVYFESPCELHQYEMTKEELIEYVKYQYIEEAFEESLEYEKTLYRDGILYDIDCPQTGPFLPDKFSIKMISEVECLNWLLEYRNK